jgi:hypothetical protein
MMDVITHREGASTMSKSRTVALALVLVGIGEVIGSVAGKPAVWYGLGVAVVGVVLLLLPRRNPADATGAEPGAAPKRDDRPTLSGLGTRVEQILKLAENQASEHKGEAAHDADAILAAARAEAKSIIEQAQAEASRLTGQTET